MPDRDRPPMKNNPDAAAEIAGMDEAQMLGPFFKEYAGLGHWFDSAHGRCVRCGVHTIDLYEDAAYGPVRRCARGKAMTASRSGKRA